MMETPGYLNCTKRRALEYNADHELVLGAQGWRNRRTTAAQRLQVSAQPPRAR